MAIVSHYSKTKVQVFPEIFAMLINKMEYGKENQVNKYDVLGSFFENHITHGRMGQFFTPEYICTMMAQMTCVQKDETIKPQSIIDPSSESGRMLVASSRILGPINYYCGIDIDTTCVKISNINFFLNGVFKCEVMQANALDTDDLLFLLKFHIFNLGIQNYP